MLKGAFIFVLALVVVGFIGSTFAPSPAVQAARASAAASEDQKTGALRQVQLKYHWWKSGFGNIMEADFTIDNASDSALKDFEITCTHAGPSGTVIDRNTRTIYEVVGPHSKRTVKNFNMGFIHSQAARSGCEVTDAAVAVGYSAPKPVIKAVEKPKPQPTQAMRDAMCKSIETTLAEENISASVRCDAAHRELAIIGDTIDREFGQQFVGRPGMAAQLSKAGFEKLSYGKTPSSLAASHF